MIRIGEFIWIAAVLVWGICVGSHAFAASTPLPSKVRLILNCAPSHMAIKPECKNKISPDASAEPHAQPSSPELQDVLEDALERGVLIEDDSNTRIVHYE